MAKDISNSKYFKKLNICDNGYKWDWARLHYDIDMGNIQNIWNLVMENFIAYYNGSSILFDPIEIMAYFKWIIGLVS